MVVGPLTDVLCSCAVLCLSRFKPEGTVAAKFGYQFIQKIDVTKKGYYTLTIKASGGSSNVAEVWEMYAKGNEAQEQIQEMCKRAQWFLEYRIPVNFQSGALMFETSFGPKPKDAGNGLPAGLTSSFHSGVAKSNDYDDQLDALSGLLSDMKGIQETTSSELASRPS